MNITINQLRAVVALASLRNFGLAAKELNMSQPAMSQAIARIEQLLDVKLFDRTTRSIELTPIAQRLLPRLRQNLTEIDDILKEVTVGQDSYVGRVAISCLSSIAVNILPDLIIDCRRHYPKLQISVQEDNSAGVIKRVSTGLAEIGICSSTDEDDRVHFAPFLQDKIGVVLPRQHILAERDVLRWHELKHFNLVLMSSETGLPQLLKFAEQEGIRLKEPAYVASHFGTITAFITRGLGIGLLPSIAWPSEENPYIKAIPLTEPKITRELGLIRLRGRTLSFGAQVISKLLQEKIVDECRYEE